MRWGAHCLGRAVFLGKLCVDGKDFLSDAVTFPLNTDQPSLVVTVGFQASAAL